MSLPTLRNDLARIYEPKAPAPSQRLATLRAARDAGLHVYVAVAPTYPDCDEADLRATLQAVAELNPRTIFHEPVNIRAENVARIEAHAQALGILPFSSDDGRAVVPRRPSISSRQEGTTGYEGGAATPPHQIDVSGHQSPPAAPTPPGESDDPSPVGRERVAEGRVRVFGEWRGAGGEGNGPVVSALRTDVFATREKWQDYAIDSLQTVERLAREIGIDDRLHLWPDKSLGSGAALAGTPDPEQRKAWLQRWWNRISEWP